MIVFPNLIDHFKNKSTHFKNLKYNHQKFLNYLILKSLFGENKHNYLTSYTQIGIVSLLSSQLQKSFGKKYLEIIEPYFDEVKHLGSADYQFYSDKKSGKKKGVTKRFKLKEWVKNEFIDFCKDPTPIDILNPNSDKPRKIFTIPANGILGKDRNGLVKKSNILINPIVKINIQSLNNKIKEVENEFNDKPSLYKKNKLETLYFYLLGIKKNLNNTLCPGSLLQLYLEHTSGRLNGKGFHLVYIPKKIRYVLFSNMDLYDYDIGNCHFRVFYELIKKYGYDCSTIKYYLDNKKKVRNDLSQITNQSIKKIKKFLISLIYGSKPSIYYENEMLKIFGEDSLSILLDNHIVKGMIKEIKKGGKIIIDKTSLRGSSKGLVLVNKWGKGKNIIQNGKKIKQSQKLSHILTGWESYILDFIYQNTSEEFRLLCFDGWISPKMDIKEISDKIKNNPDLDIDLDIEEEKIISPTTEDLIY